MVNKNKRWEIERDIGKKKIDKKKLEKEGKKAAEEGLMSLVEQRR